MDGIVFIKQQTQVLRFRIPMKIPCPLGIGQNSGQTSMHASPLTPRHADVTTCVTASVFSHPLVVEFVKVTRFGFAVIAEDNLVQ